VRRPLPAVAALLLFAGAASPRAQEYLAPADTTADATPPAWTGYATAYAYFVENDDDFVTAVVWADHGPLHQEARYNYEDLRTASLWVGMNLDGGESLAWELTVMAGGVFGSTDGIAPGYRGALYWKAFDFSSEGEYLFDSADRAEDFFYSWSELGWSKDWFRGGVALQRTRVYQGTTYFQRGVLAGGSWSGVDAAVYFFEPGSSDAAVLLLAGFGF
jgi:hypothetical protein